MTHYMHHGSQSIHLSSTAAQYLPWVRDVKRGQARDVARIGSGHVHRIHHDHVVHITSYQRTTAMSKIAPDFLSPRSSWPKRWVTQTVKLRELQCHLCSFAERSARHLILVSAKQSEDSRREVFTRVVLLAGVLDELEFL